MQTRVDRTVEAPALVQNEYRPLIGHGGRLRLPKVATVSCMLPATSYDWRH